MPVIEAINEERLPSVEEMVGVFYWIG